MTRILVTGATGLIGAPTLAPLIASGREVHAVTSRRPRTGAAAPVHWHVCDLLDARATEALASQVAATELLHLAWYAEPGRVWSSPENLRWVEASLRLLQAFTEAGGRRAVLAGSCAEYAWQESTLCVESSTPCRPATLYGAAKHGLHVIAESYAAELGLSLAWGRIFFVFGPGEHEARLGGSVARSLLRGEPAICSPWWPPLRWNLASMSGRWSWCARSDRHAPSAPSCSGSVGPITNATVCRRAGSSP